MLISPGGGADVRFHSMTLREIADEPDFEEITSLEQFRQRTHGQFGVIVIHDLARKEQIAHHRDCYFVSEDSFVEKIIDGAGRNGRYYWAKNSRIARERLGARRCKHPADKLAQ